MMFEAKISAKEQTGVMESFWSMMKELESQADQERRNLEKHMVEGYFRQWNRIMKDTARPSWVLRAERIAQEEAEIAAANASIVAASLSKYSS